MVIIRNIKFFILHLINKPAHDINELLLDFCKKGNFEKVRYCLTSPKLKKTCEYPLLGR